MELFIWVGIGLCLSQSATLSGLNLAYFSISKLRLELEAEKNNRQAMKVLALRKDSNFLLVTILWANVAVNVLLALLSGSVLTGIMAFLFSTVMITIVGEIIPQAYFSRHALRVGAFLSPLLRCYQFILYPIARPTAFILDRWLGGEAIPYLEEQDLQELIKMHMKSRETDIERVEGKGAINFLALDDLPIKKEGEIIDPDSIISLKFKGDRPVFPRIKASSSDEFLGEIQKSQKKWIIMVDEEGLPRMVMNSDKFIRNALFNRDSFNPYWHCHRPIIIKDGQTPLGQIIPRLKVNPQHSNDDVIDEDIILLWAREEKRVVTGSDILGRLLRGIVQNRAISLDRLNQGQLSG